MAKRYQRGNQNLDIIEEQKTQWSKDTKGVNRICILKRNRQHNGQKISSVKSESVYHRRTDNTMAKRYQGGNQNLYIIEEQTYTDSDFTLDIFWPLCCLFLFNIQILFTPLVSFDHCVFCSSMIYRFWLPPWYLLAIVLSVLLWYTDSDYPLVIFWPLCCLFFYDIQILITPLVSFGYCVFCSSMIYRFWLHPSYLLVIVLSVLLWYTDSDYTLCILCPLCCLFLYDIQILITPLVYVGHCVVCSSMIYRFWLHPWYLLAIVFSVPLWYTDYDYSLDIFWPLCCLFLYNIHIMFTPLVSFDHCVVCSSMIYGFWLHPWYLLAIVLSVLLWYTYSDYTLVIFWPLCCLFFYDIQILITPLVSFGHCVFCSSMIYRFWLPPWYLFVIVLSVLLWIKWPKYTKGVIRICIS